MGDQVQVNIQLIDGDTGAHTWADRFETDRRNLAEAQSAIMAAWRELFTSHWCRMRAATSAGARC